MKDYLKLHFIILLWGFTAISGKWLTLSALVVVLYRTVLAALGTGALISWRGLKLESVQKGTIWKLMLTGALVAAHWACFFWSARVANVSICLVGLAGTAFWTSIFEPLINRKSWKISELILGLLMIGAMSLLAHFEPQYNLGLLLGLLSGLAAALFTIFNGRFTQSNPPLFITFFEMIGAGISTAFFTAWFVWMDFEPLQWLPDSNQKPLAWYTDAANLFFLAIICTVYAYATSVELLRRISPFVVNLSVNLEPVYGIVLAAFIFEEWYMLSWKFYSCAGLIISAVAVHPFLSQWEQKQRESC